MTEKQFDEMLEKTANYAKEAADTATYLLSSDSAKIAIANNARNAARIAANKKIVALDLSAISHKTVKINFGSEE